MATCYRHPSRETAVSCSSCGRPICPDCMTPTPVGMRCPDCSRQRTPVRNMRSLAVEPTVTYALIAINVLIYIGTSASGSSFTGSTGGGASIYSRFALDAQDVAQGDYWRLLTSGFLHYGLAHVALNMFGLFWLGRMIEPALGHVRFAAVYFTALLCGSLGALLLSPDALTAGASGAIFGLMGAAFVMARNRGIDLMASGIGPVIVLNLVYSFVMAGHVSIGGHLGGLIGGGLAAVGLEWFARRGRSPVPALALCAVLAAAAVVASVAVAHSHFPGA
jgi:membrane associated rhomboid family serine protease